MLDEVQSTDIASEFARSRTVCTRITMKLAHSAIQSRLGICQICSPMRSLTHLLHYGLVYRMSSTATQRLPVTSNLDWSSKHAFAHGAGVGVARTRRILAAGLGPTPAAATSDEMAASTLAELTTLLDAAALALADTLACTSAGASSPLPNAFSAFTSPTALSTADVTASSILPCRPAAALDCNAASAEEDALAEMLEDTSCDEVRITKPRVMGRSARDVLG